MKNRNGRIPGWFRFLVILLYAGFLSALCPAQTTAIGAKPPDTPEQWKNLIGIYASRSDTIYIAEKDSALVLVTKKHESARLIDAGGHYTLADQIVSNDTVLTFRWDGKSRPSGLAIGAVAFQRLIVGNENGSSFRIKPLKSASELRRIALAATPPRERGEFLKPDLVDLSTLDKTIKFDIRYATTNNFVGEKFYSLAKAFLQRPAAEALVRAHRWLKRYGYGLLIHDAYRPWYVTKMFWDATPDNKKMFVANPREGSRHNRGCAVDLTLYNLKTGKQVEMTGGYDEMSERSYPGFPGGTSLERWHRDLLRTAMSMQGFTVYQFEWWHFDYKDWSRYPIGTKTFEELSK